MPANRRQGSLPRLNQTPLAQAEKLKQTMDFEDSDRKLEAPKKIKLLKKEESSLKMSVMTQSQTKMTREKIILDSDSSKMQSKQTTLKIGGGPIKVKAGSNLKTSQIQFSPQKKQEIENKKLLTAS